MNDTKTCEFQQRIFQLRRRGKQNKWLEYEIEKRKLPGGLTPEEYHREIVRITDKLNI